MSLGLFNDRDSVAAVCWVSRSLSSLHTAKGLRLAEVGEQILTVAPRLGVKAKVHARCRVLCPPHEAICCLSSHLMPAVGVEGLMRGGLEPLAEEATGFGLAHPEKPGRG